MVPMTLPSKAHLRTATATTAAHNSSYYYYYYYCYCYCYYYYYYYYIEHKWRDRVSKRSALSCGSLARLSLSLAQIADCVLALLEN